MARLSKSFPGASMVAMVAGASLLASAAISACGDDFTTTTTSNVAGGTASGGGALGGGNSGSGGNTGGGNTGGGNTGGGNVGGGGGSDCNEGMLQHFCWDGYSSAKCDGVKSFTECHPLGPCVASDPMTDGAAVRYHVFSYQDGVFQSTTYSDPGCTQGGVATMDVMVDDGTCQKLGNQNVIGSDGGALRCDIGASSGVWTVHWEGSKGDDLCDDYDPDEGVWKHYVFGECYRAGPNGSLSYDECTPAAGCKLGQTACGLRNEYASADCSGTSTSVSYPDTEADPNRDGCYQEDGTSNVADFAKWNLELACVP